jgi:DTW domain-containing protein YfiP
MSASDAVGSSRCPDCLYPKRVCFCAAVPTVVTRTRVVIIRHHTERDRSSNSGRLAHRALTNSELVDYPDGTVPPLDGAWLLFPEGREIPEAPANPPRGIVALDATWAQARKMYRKLNALRGLPLFKLPVAPMPAQRLRSAPAPGLVSTIEAIARALRILEGDAVATPLEQLFQAAVAATIATGRIPARGAS